MVQITTTIKDILQSELIKNGKNEFINRINGKTQITDANKDFAFVYKIMTYDDDVDKIVTNEFFNNYRVSDINADKFFKKMFCNKFIDRQIAPQTVEAFASRVTSLYMVRETEIVTLYQKLSDYYVGRTQGSNNNRSGYNEINSDLPQDDINMSLEADTQEYANTNTIERAFNNTNTDNSTANPDNINKLKDVWEEILDSFDLACFLQIY